MTREPRASRFVVRPREERRLEGLERTRPTGDALPQLLESLRLLLVTVGIDTKTQVRVTRLGLPDAFVDHGDTDTQWQAVGIDANGIAAAAREALLARGARRG